MTVPIIQSTWLAFGTACSLLTFSLHAHTAPTPAEQKIEVARNSLAATTDYQPFQDLARALVLRARESGDVAHYPEAERALAQAATRVPDNLENESIAISILLAKREYNAALERARVLNRKVPDDVAVYGHIVDAAAALGRYDEAEQAAQWMLDLRSTAILSLTRAAYLREAFGDVEGAIDLMQRVYPRIAPHESEERAWHLTKMAGMYAAAGRTAPAEAAATQALALFPDYHHALGQLAQVRLLQGRPGDAVALERRRLQSVPRAENVYALARALTLAGRTNEAAPAFAEFERAALARTHDADNANHELVFYYLDYARRPARALEVAAREIARRRDARTLDAYAAALYANGQRAEAGRQIEIAMAAGVCNGGPMQRTEAVARKPGARNAASPQRRCMSS